MLTVLSRKSPKFCSLPLVLRLERVSVACETLVKLTADSNAPSSVPLAMVQFWMVMPVLFSARMPDVPVVPFVFHSMVNPAQSSIASPAVN